MKEANKYLRNRQWYHLREALRYERLKREAQKKDETKVNELHQELRDAHRRAWFSIKGELMS